MRTFDQRTLSFMKTPFFDFVKKNYSKRFCLGIFNKIYQTLKDRNTDKEIISCNHIFN